MRYHDFDKLELIDEGFPPDLARCRAVCRRCGETRLIWRSADLSVTNIGPCGPEPKFQETKPDNFLWRNAYAMLDWTGEAKTIGGEFGRMVLVIYFFGIVVLSPFLLAMFIDFLIP